MTVNEKISKEIFGTDAIADYVGDLNAALTVLIKLRESGWFWQIGSYKHTEFICTLQRIIKGDDRQTFSVAGLTPSEAICECTLRIIDAKEKK